MDTGTWAGEAAGAHCPFPCTDHQALGLDPHNLLYELPGTSSHRLSGLKRHGSSPRALEVGGLQWVSQSWNPGLQGLAPSGASWETRFPCLFHFTGAPTFLGLWPHPPSWKPAVSLFPSLDFLPPSYEDPEVHGTTCQLQIL